MMMSMARSTPSATKRPKTRSPSRSRTRTRMAMLPTTTPMACADTVEPMAPQQYEADDYLPEEAEMRLIDSIPGVIERIELENFMCHANLEIEFNKHINFISGVNGSTEPLV